VEEVELVFILGLLASSHGSRDFIEELDGVVDPEKATLGSAEPLMIVIVLWSGPESLDKTSSTLFVRGLEMEAVLSGALVLWFETIRVSCSSRSRDEAQRIDKIVDKEAYWGSRKRKTGQS